MYICIKCNKHFEKKGGIMYCPQCRIKIFAKNEGIYNFLNKTKIGKSDKDTLEWYEKAHLVFIGGSLIKHGGQNPLEVLSRYCHVIMGPHYENFKFFHQI